MSGHNSHGALPRWVRQIKLYPVPPNDDYYTRARIAGIACRPDARAYFAACRQFMTAIRAPPCCPRKQCAREKQCASAYACCMWENIDTMQELVFPALRAYCARTGDDNV